MKSNIKYTGNLNGEGGWLTGIEGDPVAVDAAPGAEGWEPVNLTIDANENGDIEVEYTKPQTGIPVGNTVNFTNNTANSITIDTSRGFVYDNIGGNADPIVVAANSTNIMYAFSDSQGLNYYISLNVASETDQYVITTGSTNWQYDSREGLYFWNATDTNPINNQTYNVVITNKE